MIPKPYEKYEKVVTVACVNFNTKWGDKTANLAKMKTNIEEAVAIGSNIVVFPELALSGYECTEECWSDNKPCTMHQETAETIPGPATDELAELARKYEIYIVFGMPEKDKTDPRIRYISAPLIGPEGVIGVYRKLHLGSPPIATESLCFAPGDELPVFETRYGPIGIIICYDFSRHPELARILTLKGARLIVYPAASPVGPGKIERMVLLTQARATENFTYVAGANLVGKEITKSFYGHSIIVGPISPRFMPVYAEAGETEQIVSAALNFEGLHRMNETLDWKRERRSELINREFAKLEQEQIQSE